MRLIMSAASAAALAIVLLAGCAKHDDTSSASSTAAADASASSAADAASPAPEASSGAVPDPSPSGQSLTMQTDKGTVTMNGGTHAGKIDAPMYGNLTPKSGSPIDMTADGTHMQMGSYTTPDSFDEVDGWYKAHLGADFKNERMSMNEMQTSTYHQGDDSTLATRAISISSAKDAATGKLETTVTVVIKEKQ